jgi:sterol carrier protein 2
MTTDKQSTFEKSHIDLVGGDMTRRAADAAFRQANISAKDVQVVELHDCFAANELISYEALGLAPKGKAEELVLSGRTKLGGVGPIINVSGGLISKGHPLGAVKSDFFDFFSFLFSLFVDWPGTMRRTVLAVARNVRSSSSD